MTPLVLGVLAVLLAGPVPALVARWPVLRTTPGPAMLLWQSMALGSVLAALGAGLSLVTERAWRTEPGHLDWVIAVVALVLCVLVVARLLWSGHRVGTSLREFRRRHREQLDLLADNRSRSLRVVEYDVPVAYCLPGLNSNRVVLSEGTYSRLGEDQVAAVIAHEHAHLRNRHDLVLEAFSVLHRAFPRWVSSAAALAEVRLLVEVLADRTAARANGATPLARALVTLAEQRTPEAALGAAGQHLTERVRLLADDRPHPLQSTGLVLASALVVVAPTVFVVAPWLAGLH